MKALIERLLSESMQRYCTFYKAKDGNWYMDLADREYGDYEDSTTYGPFVSEKAALDYLDDNFSNPGGYSIDKSGRQRVPKRSPDGSRVISPRGGRRW